MKLYLNNFIDDISITFAIGVDDILSKMILYNPV